MEWRWGGVRQGGGWTWAGGKSRAGKKRGKEKEKRKGKGKGSEDGGGNGMARRGREIRRWRGSRRRVMRWWICCRDVDGGSYSWRGGGGG
jgi:hypothetical protein